MNAAKIISAILPPTIACAGSILLMLFGATHRLDNWLADIQTSFLIEDVATEIVIVEIDAQSLKELNTWPWPREFHGKLLDNLLDAGANRVFFDIDFSAASSADQDRLFANTLRGRRPGQVAFASFQQEMLIDGVDSLTTTQPHPQFRPYVDEINVNFQQDIDGVIRIRQENSEITPDKLQFIEEWVHDVSRNDSRQLTIDYAVHPRSFPRHAYADVLNSRVAASEFSNKTVFVGATAVELGDYLPVPNYGSLPGVVLQGIVAESYRHGPLQHVRFAVVATTIMLITFLLSVPMRNSGWARGLAIVAAAWICILTASVWMQAANRLLFPGMPIYLSIFFCFAITLFRRIDHQRLSIARQTSEIREKDALMAAVVETNRDAILTLDANGDIVTANHAARALWMDCLFELDGCSIDALLPQLAEEAASRETWLRKSHVNTVVELSDVAPIYLDIAITRLSNSERIQHTLLIRDVTDERRQALLLEYQANHDALTGLKNRVSFARHVEDRIGGAAKSPGALLMLDLNDFKEINDALGHGVGDDVLVELAGRLAGAAKGHFEVARNGGDEFTIYLSNESLTKSTITDVVEQLLGLFDHPVRVAGLSLGVSASIGVAVYPEDGDNLGALMQAADIAMYTAKRDQSRWRFYRHDSDASRLRKLKIASRLRTAMHENEMVTYLQPKIDLHTFDIVGAEALVRWEHPELGLLLPVDFIDLLERSELVRPMTRLVLREALHYCKRLRACIDDITVAVNLSARMLQDTACTAMIANVLTECQAEPHWLVLEITESALISDPGRAMSIADQISALGVHLSIDDFGTGYSSLAYLQRLPAKELKIDRSFISDMHINRNNEIIVGSTIQLAHDLNLRVVAEGVSDQKTLELLSTLDCDVIQGYGISEPLPIEEFEEWANQWTKRQQPQARAASF